MSMEIRILTHLDKVFQDEAPVECTIYFSGFENEKINSQLAFRNNEDARQEVQLTIQCDKSQLQSIGICHIIFVFSVIHIGISKGNKYHPLATTI